MVVYKIIKRFAWRPTRAFKNMDRHTGKWIEIQFRWFYLVEVQDDTKYRFTIGNTYYDYRSAFERMKEQIIKMNEDDKGRR